MIIGNIYSFVCKQWDDVLNLNWHFWKENNENLQLGCKLETNEHLTLYPENLYT